MVVDLIVVCLDIVCVHVMASFVDKGFHLLIARFPPMAYGLWWHLFYEQVVNEDVWMTSYDSDVLNQLWNESQPSPFSNLKAILNQNNLDFEMTEILKKTW